MGHREERQRRAHTVSQSGFVSMTSAQMGFLLVHHFPSRFPLFLCLPSFFLLLSLRFAVVVCLLRFFAASLCATLQLLQRMACPADSEQRWYTGLPTGAVRGVPCFAGDRAAETATALPAAVQIALSDHVLFKFRAYTVCLVLFCALRICCDPYVGAGTDVCDGVAELAHCQQLVSQRHHRRVHGAIGVSLVVSPHPFAVSVLLRVRMGLFTCYPVSVAQPSSAPSAGRS